MRHRITRRDFVGGMLVSTGLSAFATLPLDSAQASSSDHFVSPPLRTGMRGSHPGAFEAAHALRDGTLQEKEIKDTGEVYDLIVVGGGLSGLSVAHFFQKYAGADKTVLIIENHDDFGGHAKRNQFSVNGHDLVLNGGTLEIESPQRYNQWASMILSDIGVDIEAYKKKIRRQEKRTKIWACKRACFLIRKAGNAIILCAKARIRRKITGVLCLPLP